MEPLLGRGAATPASSAHGAPGMLPLAGRRALPWQDRLPVGDPLYLETPPHLRTLRVPSRAPASWAEPPHVES